MSSPVLLDRMAANWDPPAPGVIRFYERAAVAALDPACQARYFVGYLGDVPVCAAEAFLAHGVYLGLGFTVAGTFTEHSITA